MKKIAITLFVLLSLCLVADAQLAPEQIAVSGEPPITWEAVDGHIRVMEFVLQTRMTVAQKESFVQAILAEAATMDTEARNDFNYVLELGENLDLLDDFQREQVRQVLEKDFMTSMSAAGDDPAANLFAYLVNSANEAVIKTNVDLVTRQSMDALAEYLAFLASTENPVSYSKEEVEAIRQLIVDGFATLSEEQKAVLDDFQLNWFMVRAAWQGADDTQTKVTWRKAFARCGIAPGKLPDLAKIKMALSTDIYGDLLDYAVMSGIEPMEWSPSPNFRVW